MAKIIPKRMLRGYLEEAGYEALPNEVRITLRLRRRFWLHPRFWFDVLRWRLAGR